MIRLVYSNRTEELLAGLAEAVRARRRTGAHPLEPVELVVPNRNLERLVRLGLAERLGVAANLRFVRLERMVAELVRAAMPGGRLIDGEALRGGLLALLHDERALAQPALGPVRAYLEAPDADGVALRRVQLAGRLARLFEEYAYSRPEMLAAWPSGPTLRDGHLAGLETWQRALWLAVAGPEGWLARHPPPAEAGQRGRWVTLAELADGTVPLQEAGRGVAAGFARGAAPPLHVFGVSYVARAFQHLFHRLAATRELWLFTLNPCRELWDDVETSRELRRRQQRHFGPLPKPEEDPYGLFQDTENLPLRYWGRPGREHVRLLDDLTECDFEGRFREPDALGREPDAHGQPPLLAAVQGDVLRRAVTGQRAPRPEWAGDGSVRLLACPDPRREVEAVADAIWELVAASEGSAEPLRWSDVAVIVNAGARDLYLPQLQATFAEYHGIPCDVADLPFAGERRVAEAARLLLALPFGRFSRAEMLRVMLHPAVRGGLAGARRTDVDPSSWARLAGELGIFHGASREDLAGTYVGEDLLSWDQGLRRLALGAFMAGPRSGEERLWRPAEDGEVLVADVTAGKLESAARFALLARSLLADCRRLREERRPLGEWAAVLRTLFDAYLTAGEDEEADRLRCLAALEVLERADVGGVPMAGRVACELASAALAELTVGRGGWLGEGVAVSTLLPMRAIPFRVLFVVGLGEGEFPAANRRDALDLRAAARRAGDVTPAERDRYLFLETLLSARERLVLSYVSRDERTGERLRPSSVVQELLDVLERGYVGRDGVERLVVEVPPRRWDSAYFPGLDAAPAGGRPALAAPFTVAPGAREEVAARRLGEELRAALPETTSDVLATLRRELPPRHWEPLATFLGLPQIGGEGELDTSARPAAAAPRRLGLSTLRAFLECPLQGSAKALLGLERDDDEDPAEVEDESLRSSRLVETILLRDAFARALRRGEDPAAAYHALARRRELAGEVPTGALGEVERALHTELLAGWQASIADLAARGRGERLRLGRAHELEDVDELLPALRLVAGDGTLLGELDGRSELLLDGRRASVVCDPGGPKDDPNEGPVRELRLALRGFCDHLLLASSGALAGMKRQLVLLRRDAQGVCQVRYDLQPLRREDALAYLTMLAADLLAGVHDYLLPCEAVFHVFRLADRRLPLDPRQVRAEAVRRITTERISCASRWGPVPDPARYAPPPALRLTEVLGRRFGLFFATLGTRWELSGARPAASALAGPGGRAGTAA
jgi:exodeoxyribonuclease V gamma subunit